MTIPPHMERAIGELIERLQALTDSQLAGLAARQREQLDPSAGQLIGGRMVWDDDPIEGVGWALYDLRVAEANYRLGVIWNTESEMQGGHRTHVSKDDETLGMWRARCAPWWEYTGGEEKPCWEGPERSHVEDAIEDARRHHPSHEPWHIEK